MIRKEAADGTFFTRQKHEDKEEDDQERKLLPCCPPPDAGGQNLAPIAAISESDQAREGVRGNRTKTKTRGGTFASLAVESPDVRLQLGALRTAQTSSAPPPRSSLALPLMNIHLPH